MRSAEFVMFSWLLHHAWTAFLQTVHTCSPFTGILFIEQTGKVWFISMDVTVSSDSWAKLNSRSSSSLSIAFAASARQLWQTQESSASAVLIVRSAHGKCHQVLQVSQQILFSFAESPISSSSKITLLHFGQSKMSLYPNRHGNTNDL